MADDASQATEEAPQLTRFELAVRLCMARAKLTIDGTPVKPGAAKPTYFYIQDHEDLGDLRPVSTPYKPTKDEKVRWEADGLLPVWQVGSKRGPHALIGAGRALAELTAIDIICSEGEQLGRAPSVADVGSNAERFRAAVAVKGASTRIGQIHHLIPVVQNGDAERLAGARSRYEHCTCLYADCPHIIGFDIHLFQHSLYYTDAATVLAKLGDSGVAVATVHHCFDAAGVIEGQLAYHVRRDGLIEARAKGNAYPYVHPSNGWLRAGRYTDGRSTLAWEHVHEFFGTHVYIFRVLRGTYEGPTGLDPWAATAYEADVSDDVLRRFNGEITSAAKTRALGYGQAAEADAHTVPVRRLALRYGIAYAYMEGTTVVAVPLDLIGQLTARATGVPRDTVLQRTLFEHGKRYLLAGNHPPQLIPDCLLLAVAAAMTRGAECEAAQLGRMNATHGALFRAHADVLAGRQVKLWRWYHNLLPQYWFATCCLVEEHQTDEAVTYHQLRAGGLAPTVNAPVRIPDGTWFMPVYGRKTTTLPPTSEGAGARLLPDTQRRPPPEKGIRLALIALGAFVPTNARADAEAVRHAFLVRIGRAVPAEDMEAWERLYAIGRIGASVLRKLHYKEPIAASAEDRQAWLQRFPENQRGPFIAAEAELKHRQLGPGDLTGSFMIKDELSAMCTAGGMPYLDERGIISYKPTRQWATGVYDWLSAKRLRAEFSLGAFHEAVWVNGPLATAEAFGQWFDAAVSSVSSHVGEVWYWVGDHSKFEAHRGPGAFDYTRKLQYAAINDKNYRYVRDGSADLRGRAQRFDVQYKAKYKLGSGGTETSLDSFQRNVTALVHCFGEPTWGRMLFAVNGDDFLVVAGFACDVADYHEKNAQIGFEADLICTKNIAEVEFCQTIPWPCEAGTVWGPKLGRVLSRLPWTTSTAKDDPRGVAIGMLTCSSHVPFLKQYLTRVFALSPGVSPVYYKYHVAARQAHECTAATMAFAELRYGLTYADLVEFDALLTSVNELGVVANWAHLDRMVAVDE